MASKPWASNRKFDTGDADGRPTWFNENVHGAIVLAAAAASLVGLAFGAMVVLTSPDGWAAKIANSSISGEGMSLVAYDISSANQ